MNTIVQACGAHNIRVRAKSVFERFSFEGDAMTRGRAQQ